MSETGEPKPTLEMTEQPVTMSQLLQIIQNLTSNKSGHEGGSNQNINLNVKLNHHNYTQWSKLMYLAISGRGKLKHIIASPPQPNDPGYIAWTQQDATVVTWILENIEADLVNNFLDYPTAQDLWKGIEVLFSNGQDELQVYDLTVRANTMKQGTDSVDLCYVDRPDPSVHEMADHVCQMIKL